MTNLGSGFASSGNYQMNSRRRMIAICIYLTLALAGRKTCIGESPRPTTVVRVWKGVPHPARSFGYDPLTVSRPSRPSAWPSEEVENHYYIDCDAGNCSDSKNPFGYPDKPRRTLPVVTFAAGSYIEIHGSGYKFSAGNQWQPTFKGSLKEPIWIVGEKGNQPTMNGKWTLRGSSHFIVENIRWETNGTAIDLRENNRHAVIRNVEALGDGTSSKGGAAFGASSSSKAGRNKYIVFYRLNVHDVGDRSLDVEDDVMGVTAGTNCDFVWVLDSDIVRVGGDSVRPGTNKATLGKDLTQRATHIYIAGNRFSDNGENAVDVKFSENVVVSQNDMHTMRASKSSGGACVVIHEKASNVFVVDNRIHNCEIGVITTDGVRDAWYIGNVIYKIHDAGKLDVSAHYGAGAAMHVRGGSTGGALFNSLFDYDKGFQGSQPGAGYRLEGNIFYARSRQDSYDVMYADSTRAKASVQNYNLFGAFRARVGNSDHAMPSFAKAFGHEVNGVSGNPMYGNPKSGNLSIRDGSPAIDAGPPALQEVFAEYESIFGVSLDQDRDGDTRPQRGGLDIGADELP
jgi:hypothetical protein